MCSGQVGIGLLHGDSSLRVLPPPRLEHKNAPTVQAGAVVSRAVTRPQRQRSPGPGREGGRQRGELRGMDASTR
jgi:hypothetical protein